MGLSNAETLAMEATQLEAFPINIPDIRRTISLLLTEFGRHGLFEEYTIHDISHIDAMLKSLDWLVPKTTLPAMSKADWLLTVLSCYLHDLGLVVTKKEFDERDRSDFRKFCNDVLFAGSQGEDYKAKVYSLDAPIRERLLYQEYVRSNHASRVRAWIEGRPNTGLGEADKLAAEVERLLAPLDPEVRRDLALICESHNLDDIEEIEKYRLSQPYGNSEEETANIQYVAILLRTADLLHITRGRAPSALYRTIDPSDPVSQREWVKQSGVKSVRPKVALDEDGNADPNLQSDTIEVHALFAEPDGFFGLGAYLRYAQKEIQKSFGIAEDSKRRIQRKYEFPWRIVDDSHVKAEGFLSQRFGFVIDQEKILDLLTGHTLYNDSAIAIRELVQNSIDAVRLQSQNDLADARKSGRVEIRWNSETSKLEIADNGTGMTQEIIENHLLKVGSSRYQDPRFQEEHPNFSPISRFGIGVLSAFMIADEVQIVTCSEQESEARQISLRSVHGRYLIRLLPKSAPEVQELLPHGTLVRIALRPSAKRVDVLKSVRRWIMFPGCQVSVSSNDGDAQAVGFDSPQAALEEFLASSAVSLTYGGREFKVQETELDGLTIAYAMHYSQLYREWVPASAEMATYQTTLSPPIGTCIEGIAVEFSPPGYDGSAGVLSVANAFGKGAPKTNVARTALEKTPELNTMFRKIYAALIASIGNERKRLVDEEKYSLSWAMHEIPYIGTALFSTLDEIALPEIMADELQAAPFFLLEKDGSRNPATAKSLAILGEFWTADSPLLHSIEQLVREIPNNISAGSLLPEIKAQLPRGPMVVTPPSEYLIELLRENFDVAKIRAIESERRVELLWQPYDEKNERWLTSSSLSERLNRTGRHSTQSISNFFNQINHRRDKREMFLCTSDVPIEGLDAFIAVETSFGRFFLPNVRATALVIEAANRPGASAAFEALMYLELLSGMLSPERQTPESSRARLDRLIKRMASEGMVDNIERLETFGETALESNLRVFKPFAWWDRAE